MASRAVEAVVSISNSPATVIDYVTDMQNRMLYLNPLQSITNLQGEATEVGSSWNWSWMMLGVELEGVGVCTEYEAGKCYAFRTEGGIVSTFSYRAEPEGEGAKLAISVDFEVPSAVAALPGGEGLLTTMEQSEAEKTVQNLKAILDQ